MIVELVWAESYSKSARRYPCIPGNPQHILRVCKTIFNVARAFLPPTSLCIDYDDQYVRAAAYIIYFNGRLLQDCKTPQFRNITHLIFTYEVTSNDPCLREALELMRLEKLTVLQHNMLSILGTPPVPLPFLHRLHLNEEVHNLSSICSGSTALNVILQHVHARGDASPIEARPVTLPDNWLSSLSGSTELFDVDLEFDSSWLFDVGCIGPRTFSYRYCATQILPIIRLWTVNSPSILLFNIDGAFTPGRISFHRNPGQRWEDFEFPEDDPLGSASGRSGWQEWNMYDLVVEKEVNVGMWNTYVGDAEDDWGNDEVELP